MEKYALLFSGRSELRHLNDLEFSYRTLTEQCQFKPSNIHVLYFNGMMHFDLMDFELLKKPLRYYDDDSPFKLLIDDMGNQEALKLYLNKIGKKITPDDSLFIHTTGHGSLKSNCTKQGIDGSHLSCAMNQASISADYLGGVLSLLPSFKSLVVVMGQCYGGGFEDNILINSTAQQTFFSAACKSGAESAGSAHFSPFTHYWVNSLKNNPFVDPIYHHLFATAHTLKFDTPVYAEQYVNKNMREKFNL